MSFADYEMAELTAKLASECLQKNESVPNDIFQNLLTSIGYLTINCEKFGPNVETFCHYLEEAYAYDDADDLEGFAIGAVYGATQFCKTFLEIKKINRNLLARR